MLSRLRAQIRPILEAIPARRKPALRRSDAPDALLATDLPMIAGADAVDAFRKEIAALGWHTDMRKGWLTLDAPVPVPDAPLPHSLAGPWGCCISLLLRHPDDAPAEEFIRAVVKATDCGHPPFQRLCRQLHAEFAARLRRREPLPGALLPYLCEGCKQLHEGGTP